MGWEKKKGLKERHLGYLSFSLEGDERSKNGHDYDCETSRKAKHRTLRMEASESHTKRDASRGNQGMVEGI